MAKPGAALPAPSLTSFNGALALSGAQEPPMNWWNYLIGITLPIGVPALIVLAIARLV